MGRTIPSFRTALEVEIQSWSAFRKSLGKANRDNLDHLFDQARSNCMAAGNAVRPVVFEGMLMAIVFSHEKRLAHLVRNIEELRLEMNPRKGSEQE
jgi:hypothetical protein